MQKLVKRTAEAQRAAARRNKKKVFQEYSIEKIRRRQEQKQNVGEIGSDLRAARTARREAWEAGPLAPRRDLDGNLSFAAMETSRLTSAIPLKAWEIEQRCAWAGGSKYLGLAVKDRVVVMEGPDKGKIDRIAEINMTSATVKLENAARHIVKIPDVHRQIDSTVGATQAVPSELPISAIRLVHPITDPKTGVTRDVIIRQITPGAAKWHRHTGWRAWPRYVTGMNISIPWPEREEKVYIDQPGDTVRADVEEPTFVPSLLRCPIPDELINELRNKYSKFRTRHEEDYVLRLEAEERTKKAGKKVSLQATAATSGMLTPVQDLNRQQRELRRAKGQPELSDEMLAKIGQVIARNKADVLRNAGVSEVRDTLPPPSS